MNLSWLSMGMPGAFEAGALSLVIGLIVQALVRRLAKGQDWTHAHEIAWSFLITVAISAGADIWHLVYLGIVPMESTVTIERVLAGVHDPDYLAMRVIFELIGSMAGVMAGWGLWTAVAQRRSASSDA